LHDNERVSMMTKIRVQKLARELDYEPNQKAVFFQQKKTFMIGVVLPDLTETFFTAAISAIEDTSSKYKYSVLLGQSHDSETREKHIVETIMNQRVDGLIVSIAKSTTNFDHFDLLKKYGVPVVFFDRIPNIPNIHYVTCDMEMATVQAMKFLLRSGHRAIGMINGPERLSGCQQRVEGYIRAMRSHPLKYDPSLIVSTDLTKEYTEKAMEALLTSKRRPTAVLAYNDDVALDAMEFARKKKLKINKDIAFVTFSSQPMINYTANPPVASVEQFPYQQGQIATEILVELLSRRKDHPEITAFNNITLESKLAIHRQM
jgi:LacI family repressor for deo operon, udp, cdd, tsx, nupC, and nupG